MERASPSRLVPQEQLQNELIFAQCLHRLAIELPQNMEPRTIIKNAVEILCRELKYETGHWFHRDDDDFFTSGSDWIESAGHGTHVGFRQNTESLRRKVGEGVIGKVLEIKKALFVSNLRHIDFGRNKIVSDHPYLGALFLPVFFDKQLLFVIELFSLAEKAQAEGFERFITTVCHDLEIHIDRILRIKRELEHLRNLAQAQRLSNLGLQISTISHELKNPTAIIRYYGDKLHQQLSEFLKSAETVDAADNVVSLGRDQLQKWIFSLEKIKKQVVKSERIIASSRNLSRDASQDPDEVQSMSELIDDLKLLLEVRMMTHGLEFQWDVEDFDLKWSCRQGQLEQILQNLINNAVEAVKELSERWIRFTSRQESEHLIFMITDSGSGIPPEIAAKIMQPFFSTKGQSSGLGLGLNVSRRMAEEMGGSLTIDSECPNTRFIVKIPLKS